MGRPGRGWEIILLEIGEEGWDEELWEGGLGEGAGLQKYKSNIFFKVKENNIDQNCSKYKWLRRC